VRVPLALVLATAAVVLVYLALPNVRQRPRLVVPGAVVAVALWALGSWGFQLYVEHFGRFGATYGSIGAVIVLLTYLWLAGQVLLLGAEVNAVVQRGAPRPGDAELREVPRRS
jgi:membrane protein